MKYNGDDKYILESTGRCFYANCGIIGIDQEFDRDNGLCVSEGYDGWIDLLHTWGEEKAWTPDEAIELADYMIALWTRFKQVSPVVLRATERKDGK